MILLQNKCPDTPLIISLLDFILRFHIASTKTNYLAAFKFQVL
jgi:hypothetical protein